MPTTIKESNLRYPYHTEKCLNRIDALGNRGIDLLKQHDIIFVTEGKADYGISWHGEPVPDVPLNKTILYRGEPPIYNLYFGRKLNKRSFFEKYMTVISDYILEDSPAVYCAIPMEFDLTELYFNKPKTDFICFIAKNKTFGIWLNCMIPSLHKYKKYSLMRYREQLDETFSKQLGTKYQSYGAGWQPSTFIGPLPQHGNFLVMASHQFTLATENCSIPGYVCEKVIYPMFCGSIPVYKGPPDINKYVPKDCFINLNDFEMSEICSYLLNFTYSDLTKYLQNIKRFITTKESYTFSSVNYAEKLIKIIEGG